MLLTNWDERLDPDYNPILDEEENFDKCLLGFIEDMISTLKEMQNLIQHKIEREHYLQ